MSNSKRAHICRMPGHDYKAPYKYHLTLLKHPYAPAFGQLAEGWREAALDHRRNDVRIQLSDSGKAVRNALFAWKNLAPQIQIYQYSIMPDHLHLLVEVMEYLDESIGRYIGRFTQFARKRWQYRQEILVNLNAPDNHIAYTPLFEEGFNDQIIMADRNLDTVFKYVKHNPYKLAIRKALPDFFKRRYDLTLNLPSGLDHALAPVRLQA